jgi:aromatic-L-amino-acid decarboxylase
MEKLVAYTSKQSHSSVEKGARIAGFSHLRAIEVDRHLAMDPSHLERAIARDLAAGLVPTVVVSTMGSTGTNAVDPIEAIGAISSARGLWHHVDAAYAGTAMICPELRSYQRGLEAVDSYSWNPHKWMFTNFDCSVFWVADREPLLATMGISPPYLKNAASDSGAVIDYRDWHVPLGRRFRALKLWFVLRSYGSQGLRFHIREHLRLARQFANRITDHPRLELVAPTPFALVSFRHLQGDQATLALAETINNSGKAYVTPSKLPDGSDYLRVSIGQTWTEQRHLDYLWQLIRNTVMND